MSTCLTLHGVNVDQLIDRLLALASRTGVKGSTITITGHDRDDYRQELRITAWQMSERYAPNDTGSDFERFVLQRLRWRLIDLLREREGRTRWTWGEGVREATGRAGGNHEREPAIVLSLDADPERDRLGDALRGRTPDPADDRSPTLARALLPRDRRENGAQPAAGLGRSRRARRRDRSPDDVGRAA